MRDDQERGGGAKPGDTPVDTQEMNDENTATRSGKQQPADDGLKPENVNPLAPPINIEGGG